MQKSKRDYVIKCIQVKSTIYDQFMIDSLLDKVQKMFYWIDTLQETTSKKALESAIFWRKAWKVERVEFKMPITIKCVCTNGSHKMVPINT